MNPSTAFNYASILLYVADSYNHQIRCISPTGGVSVLSGSTRMIGFLDASLSQAMFNTPIDVAVDAMGTVFVADSGNNRIRSVTPTGTVTTFAGSTLAFSNGVGTAATFKNPVSLVFDASGVLFVADADNNAIRSITPASVVTTYAGQSTSGHVEGAGANAKFSSPGGLAFNSAGTLLVADTSNNVIRAIARPPTSSNTRTPTRTRSPSSPPSAMGIPSGSDTMTPSTAVIISSTLTPLSGPVSVTVTLDPSSSITSSSTMPSSVTTSPTPTIVESVTAMTRYHSFSRFQFSWNTVPTQAFPGASSRFMTPVEVTNFTRDFSSLMIWGIGATCLDPKDNVTSFPAFCYGSWCQCYPQGSKLPLETQRFVTNMDDNLQAQGAALKAAAAAQGLVPRPILGYVDHMSPQQYFYGQNALRENPALGNYLARLEWLQGEPIDCMNASRGGCCEQGSEFGIYDFGQPAVVKYYAEHVIGALIDGDGLDGTFLDSIDWALTFGCGNRWTCTDAEQAGLVNGSLAALDAALSYAAVHKKLLSVSAHTNLFFGAWYYEAQIALIAQHGNAWRFYEGFSVDSKHMATYLYEAQGLNVTSGNAVASSTNYSVPVMLHIYDDPVYSPDWVQLAAFLIGANENSYFSSSAGWAFDSFSVYPEFSRPLGTPFGSPSVTTVGTLTTYTREYEHCSVLLTDNGDVWNATLGWKVLRA